MIEYKYKLEPYRGLKTRYTCPNCGHNKSYTRYIETDSGEHLAEHVGRCNRESNCGYHYPPKQYFSDNIHLHKEIIRNPTTQKKISNLDPLSYIPSELFERSLSNYEENNFVLFLKKLFGKEVTNQLIKQYQIGTSKKWNNSTIFWQIDILGKIRTGKIMLYDPISGKRIRKPYNHISWVHSSIKFQVFNLKQCLFGEQLLEIEPLKPVAIVESEKTAIIASVYLPEYIWLAVGGINNLNIEKCKVLRGRNVVLYPDLNAFQKWKQRVNELSTIGNFKVSNLLETNAIAAEKLQGMDLVDYIINELPDTFKK
ncbi:MAG: hypothetical protein IPO78_11040 [Saprospiraceae bacterium]|nr:hypothetical protein [Saprospiraceae bacterium]